MCIVHFIPLTAILLATGIWPGGTAFSGGAYDLATSIVGSYPSLVLNVKTAHYTLKAPVRVSPSRHNNARKSGRIAEKPGKKIYLGKASWICTPSGFGHKSTCVTRGAKT